MFRSWCEKHQDDLYERSRCNERVQLELPCSHSVRGLSLVRLVGQLRKKNEVTEPIAVLEAVEEETGSAVESSAADLPPRVSWP